MKNIEYELICCIVNEGMADNAMEVAKKKNNKIIGLCGYDGGQVKLMSDVCFHVNKNNMQIVEDIHMILDHCMMFILSKTIHN